MIIANKPAIASLPAIVVSTAAFSALLMPSVAVINFFIVAAKFTDTPSVLTKYEPASSAENPNFLRASACFSVGLAILANTFLSAVPALLPLTPALAAKPIAVDISVIVIPNEPA